MTPVQVAFTFTPESFGKAQVYIMLRFLKKGWLKWILLLAATYWIGLKFYLGGLNFQYIANALAWILVMAVIWWLIFRWLSRRNFSRFPNLQYLITYVFTEADIRVITHTSDGLLQWDTFEQADESRDFFLLYQNAYMASPILKTGFQNETEMERFRELLRTKGLLK